MGRRASECVTFSEVEIGIDSESGKAVSIKIEDEWHWIPYSQIEELVRDPNSRNNDKVVMTRWIAQQKGLDV